MPAWPADVTAMRWSDSSRWHPRASRRPAPSSASSATGPGPCGRNGPSTGPRRGSFDSTRPRGIPWNPVPRPPLLMITFAVYAAAVLVRPSRQVSDARSRGITAQRRCVRSYTTSSGGGNSTVRTTPHHVYELPPRWLRCPGRHRACPRSSPRRPAGHSWSSLRSAMRPEISGCAAVSSSARFCSAIRSASSRSSRANTWHAVSRSGSAGGSDRSGGVLAATTAVACGPNSFREVAVVGVSAGLPLA